MDGPDRTEKEEDHILALDLNLTTASVLYVAIKQSLISFTIEKEELSLKYQGYSSIENSNQYKTERAAIKESLEMLDTILSTTHVLLKEVIQIIRELEPVESTPKPKIILKT